mmetsp:Transcript_3258/g.6074  ORF Transcript_3258/g.6074 Transcript_3258/m.6074 type:complete len:90 (-) Transcript_3258:4-273(-)
MHNSVGSAQQLFPATLAFPKVALRPIQNNNLKVRALVETGDHLRTQIAKATSNNHPFSGFDVECRAAVRRCGHASNEQKPERPPPGAVV